MAKAAHLTLSDAEIYYEESGLGDPLLLIHGSGCTADTWHGIRDNLSSNARLITYDRRGFFRSKGPPAELKTYFETHGEDASEILTLLKASPAVVVGWSGGGLTALSLALAHPEVIRHLVLVEPPFHARKYMTPTLIRTAIRMKFWQALRQPRRSARCFYEFATSYRTGGCGFERLDSASQEQMLSLAANTIREFDAGTGEQFSEEQIKSIKLPITFILGDLTPPTIASATERLLKIRPEANLIRVPNAAHLMHIDQPSSFSKAIMQVMHQ